MTRSLPIAIAGVLDASVLYPFFAIEIMFDTAPLRLWSGLGELVIRPYVYTGGGTLLTIDDIQETSDIGATGAKVTLSSIPTSVLSLALRERYQGRRATLYFGLTDVGDNYLENEDGTYVLRENSGRIILDSRDELVNIFEGYLDQMNIAEGPNTSAITVSIESKLIDLQRKRIRRFTHEDQQRRFPGDMGFEKVEEIQDMRYEWRR